ncbi:MAG: glycosyltransferase [Candidatus Omnitrophica bacterium]|nr:glycosyltransferase [Candidatus Omnitrophota bacterium]MBU1997770.1 glycosyltransferase [Candidatus Omnitrophota bacterium]MBU4333348.1 glycosyltransferase [Candidatus Omnitrophota bacterium]
MNKHKNITHLIPTLGIGGAEKVVLNICKNYDKEKYAITVIYWLDHKELLNDFKETGVKVIKLDFKNTISLKTVYKVCKILKTHSTDILHTHFFDADLIGFFASLITRVPLIINIHSYPFPVERKHSFRYKILSLFVKKVLCVSETVKIHVLKETNIKPDLIEVIHNGIELCPENEKKDTQDITDAKNSFRISRDNIIIGNISRLIADKGQKFLIQAIPLVLKQYPNLKVIIVGDGPLKSDLSELTKKLSLENIVIFTGTMTNIATLLNIFDIFVFPTFNEALGLTVLEAMAAAKPIIATNDAAIPELIKHNEEGLLVSPGNPKEIANALIFMIENPEKAKEFGLKAKEKVKMFSAAIMVSKIQKVYDDILS